MDFDSMKYAELRSFAKKLGLKANMKADKLLKSIKQHYDQEKNMGEIQEGVATAVEVVQHETPDSSPQNKDQATFTEEVCNAVFVNTRRGKRGGATKRKIPDPVTLTEKDAKPTPSTSEVGTEEAAPGEPCGARASKKRRVSSPKDSVKAENEPPKEQQISDAEQQPDVRVEVNAGKQTKGSKGGRIPRYQGTQQKTKPLLKTTTPNFKKLHEAHFNKMESVESYVQRKTKQMESYKNSFNDLKKLADKTKMRRVESKSQGPANPSRVSMCSPAPPSKKAAEERRRHTLLSASKAPNKPAEKDVAPFRPTVLSMRRINVRFSEATQDNEHKKSLVKTPARKSPCVTSSTPKNRASEGGKSSNVKASSFSATKSPGLFVFTSNTSTSTTPGTNKKVVFDLKASLSRPLNYKPHAGKLKPIGDVKENAEQNKSLLSNSHQKNYKQHQVQTRGERRAKHVGERKQKKESILGARRGLVMM